MYEQAITSKTKCVLESLNKSGITKDFYLAGGTALALYLGHRFSIDLDFFSPDFSYTPNFKNKLSEIGNLTIDEETEDTFNGSIDGVKVSFLKYPYPLISPKEKYMENVYLAGKEDIAIMKLEAIAGRGSYKDFIDIYFLLQEFSLGDILNNLKKKFDGIDYNTMHLIKALNYFDDVENSEMPQMIKKVNWEDIKKKLINDTQKYL